MRFISYIILNSIFTVALLIGVSPQANATLLFDFSYTGLGIAASGNLITTDTLVGGHYTVTDITGTRNGITITALLAPGTFENNDNLLFPGGPLLSDGGISYVAGGSNFNFYFDDFVSIGCDTLQYKEATGGTCNGDPIISLSITQDAVPEPGTLALFGVGLFGLGFIRRRRLGV
jgi:hypothetical protein